MPTPNALFAAAKTSRAQDVLDQLIDARPATAASRIAKMDADDLRPLLLAAVTGVHRKYRVPAALPAEPEARATEVAERTRRVLADCLTANPEAIVPMILAVGDATAAHDPRRAAA